MLSVRTLFLLLVLGVTTIRGAQAGPGRERSGHDAEARNETAAPGWSAQQRQATGLTAALHDKLRLGLAQQQALAPSIAAGLQAAALAATAADLSQAQHQHLQAVGRILSVSQLALYLRLRPELSESLPADASTQLAIR